MNKTIVINLLGAPGAGKSTLAALIFSKLKMKNIACEIVTEFAKDLVWDKSLDVLNNQLYVFSEQFHRLWRLEDKVKIIITDSPILLSIYYNSKQDDKNKLDESIFNNLILSCYNRFYNINYFVRRNFQYEVAGRKHDEAESNEIEKDMLELYTNLNIDYEQVISSDDVADMIIEQVINLI